MNGLKNNLGKYASIVTAIWAALCPICYLAPFLIGAGFGGALIFTAKVGEKILIALILISLLGLYLDFKVHSNILPLILAIFAGGVMYYARFINFNLNLLYIGSLTMIGAALMDILLRRKNKNNCVECFRVK